MSVREKDVVFRTVGQVSEEEIEAASLRSIEALEHMLDVRWIRSYYPAEEGKIYCGVSISSCADVATCPSSALLNW